MSKYKVGDKFVVEIKEVLNDELPYDTENLYRIDGFKTLVFDDYGLDKLQKYDKYAENLERNHEVLKIFEEKYNKGLNDAWELARKLVLSVSDGGISIKDFEIIFGAGLDYKDILKIMTPQEALAKIEAYEKSQQIQVGDVVVNINQVKLLVTATLDNGHFEGINEYGSAYTFRADDSWKKTGRHIDIEHLLEQIRGDE